MTSGIFTSSEFRCRQAIEPRETAVQVLGSHHSGLTTSQVQPLSETGRLSEQIQTCTNKADQIQTAVAIAGHGRATITGSHRHW